MERPEPGEDKTTVMAQLKYLNHTMCGKRYFLPYTFRPGTKTNESGINISKVSGNIKVIHVFLSTAEFVARVHAGHESEVVVVSDLHPTYQHAYEAMILRKLRG